MSMMSPPWTDDAVEFIWFYLLCADLVSFVALMKALQERTQQQLTEIERVYVQSTSDVRINLT
eukprot:4844979-Ditylum_brightwellii.AAC.1